MNTQINAPPAVLKEREPRDVIQFVVDSLNCDWVVSEEILAEYSVKSL